MFFFTFVGVCSSLLWLIKHFKNIILKITFYITTVALEQVMQWYMEHL